MFVKNFYVKVVMKILVLLFWEILENYNFVMFFKVSYFLICKMLWVKVEGVDYLGRLFMKFIDCFDLVVYICYCDRWFLYNRLSYAFWLCDFFILKRK